MIKTYVKGTYKKPPCLMIWRSYDKGYDIAYCADNNPSAGFRSDYNFKTQKESKAFLVKHFPDSNLWIEKSNGDFVMFQEGVAP